MANISITKEVSREEAIDRYRDLKSKIEAHTREITRLNVELVLIEPQLTTEEKATPSEVLAKTIN